MDGGKKVPVTIDEPCLITVDIDCHMDEQLTGMEDTKKNGKPIPTLTFLPIPFLTHPRWTIPFILSIPVFNHRVKEKSGEHFTSYLGCMI